MRTVTPIPRPKAPPLRAVIPNPGPPPPRTFDPERDCSVPVLDAEHAPHTRMPGRGRPAASRATARQRVARTAVHPRPALRVDGVHHDDGHRGRVFDGALLMREPFTMGPTLHKAWQAVIAIEHAKAKLRAVMGPSDDWLGWAERKAKEDAERHRSSVFPARDLAWWCGEATRLAAKGLRPEDC